MFEMTRGAIISEGLSQAGRPDLISNARLWLNQFLEKQYNNQDWPWLIKSVEGLAVVQGGAIPTDYRSAVSATIGRTATNQNKVRLVAADEFHERFARNRTDAGGTPEVIYIDELNRTFQYWPEPDSGLLLNMRYYFYPELPDHNDPTSDNLEPVWRPNKQILTQAIYVAALEYNDDNRFDKEEKKLMLMINSYKTNSHDLRAGRHRLRLGKSFRPRRGRF